MYVHVSVGACGGESVTFPLMTQVGVTSGCGPPHMAIGTQRTPLQEQCTFLTVVFLLFWFVCFWGLKQGLSV